MTADQSPTIEYASAPAPAPRPGFWLVVCFALGWILTVFGGLGVLANAGLIIATWYFDLPRRADRPTTHWIVLAACVGYTLLGLLFLRIRYRKRGAR